MVVVNRVSTVFSQDWWNNLKVRFGLFGLSKHPKSHGNVGKCGISSLNTTCLPPCGFRAIASNASQWLKYNELLLYLCTEHTLVSASRSTSVNCKFSFFFLLLLFLHAASRSPIRVSYRSDGGRSYSKGAASFHLVATNACVRVVLVQLSCRSLIFYHVGNSV